MSKKNKKIILEQSEVNVVPLMDILTTMLFFLILMASAANYATLFGSGQEGSGTATDQVKFDIAVALHHDKSATIHLTDPNYLKPINPDSMSAFIQKRYRSSGNKIISREFSAKDINDLARKVQEDLKVIKTHFPLEKNLTLAIADKVSYQQMLIMMDYITQTDEGKTFKVTDQIGRERDYRELFPSIGLRGLSNDIAQK